MIKLNAHVVIKWFKDIFTPRKQINKLEAKLINLQKDNLFLEKRIADFLAEHSRYINANRRWNERGCLDDPWKPEAYEKMALGKDITWGVAKTYAGEKFGQRYKDFRR